ncbi:MAG TPA: pitrilysin family protein [Candidatus Binatia bacterium]|nr:pitrilysin family protein [Candidatus Binatia bacterium]
MTTIEPPVGLATTGGLRRTVLPNGIRVLTEVVPQFASTTIGIWVENGSRYETPQQNGISHFLEHIFFKGTERRTAKQIAEEIDAVGGVLNAFTGKEYTCYYAKVLREDVSLAIDVLSDLFLHSQFDAQEIERERSVILQEISEVEDTPDDHIHDLFNRRFWPGHPLSWPICGTAETVGGLVREDFLRFIEQRYRPDRLIIAAAGGIDHDWLVEQIQAAFGGLRGVTDPQPLTAPEIQPGIAVFQKPLEQVHMHLGVPGMAQADERRYAAFVLNTALGGGMSSRLFQEVRERRGKAYSISSFLSSFRNAGYLAVYAGLSAACVHEVLEVVVRELATLRDQGLGDEELTRAKSQIKGNMLLALESSESRMTRIAKNEIYFGHDIPPSEVADAIGAVSGDDVRAIARDLFRDGQVGVALLGDLDGSDVDDALLSLA